MTCDGGLKRHWIVLIFINALEIFFSFVKTCTDSRKVSGDFVSYNSRTAVQNRTILHTGVIEPGVHLSSLEDKDGASVSVHLKLFTCWILCMQHNMCFQCFHSAIKAAACIFLTSVNLCELITINTCGLTH